MTTVFKVCVSQINLPMKGIILTKLMRFVTQSNRLLFWNVKKRKWLLEFHFENKT